METKLSKQAVHPPIRWVYAAAGLVVLLFAGFVYGWSIFSAPISREYPAWSQTQLSMTFSVCIAFFCLGGFAAGLLSRRVHVRVNVFLAAALFLAGFLLASRAQSPGMLYLSYGVLCGAGSGFAYNAVMSTMTRWFPDKQGIISGVLLMGFGASSMLLGTLFDAVTPVATGAWRDTFRIMGIVIAAVLVLGSAFFRLPPADGDGVRNAARDPARQFTPAQMVRQSSFWLFFLWAILVSGVGLAVISQARPLAAGVGESIKPGSLSMTVGLISICNGIGRVVCGALFDRLGWRKTLVMICLTSLCGILLLMGATHSGQYALVVAGFVLTGLAYGGSPTMSSALTGRFFGTGNYAVNFPIVNMNLLAASFAGTAAGALYDAAGSYLTTLTVFGACSVVSGLLAGLIREPGAEDSDRDPNAHEQTV